MMKLKNNVDSYGLIAKAFHWSMAILIVFMFVTIYSPKYLNLTSQTKGTFYFMHKSTGVLLLFLVCLRLVWRLANISPSHNFPLWQALLARINFIWLYFLMFAMPISGMAMSRLGGKSVPFYGLFTIDSLPKNEHLSSLFFQAHQICSYLLLACIFFHILGAIYHVSRQEGSALMNLYSMRLR